MRGVRVLDCVRDLQELPHCINVGACRQRAACKRMRPGACGERCMNGGWQVPSRNMSSMPVTARASKTVYSFADRSAGL
jgi:hypothetical protein